jgi:SAM-dependent methyltransferase
MINRTAATGFTRAADEYERGRPDYPAALIERLTEQLSLGPGRTIVDLGAGTGKLTRLLVPTGAKLIAVEPLEAMGEKLRAAVPEADLYLGTAEVIPLPDVSADAVIVAQAFHWFDHPRALREIARILRPQGQLALVWNIRDETIPWIHAMTALLEPYEGETPRYLKMTWKAAITTPLEHEVFPHVQRATREQVRDRMTSISFIATLLESERRIFLAKLDELLKSQAEPLELAYQTHVYFTTPARDG